MDARAGNRAKNPKVKRACAGLNFLRINSANNLARSAGIHKNTEALLPLVRGVA